MKIAYILLIAAVSLTIGASAQNVIVSPGNTGYNTLKAAFDAVNNGTHTGKISISIVNNTIETATASLNASGSGAAAYSSIEINTMGNYSVSGSLAAPIISFNGASNVTLSGENPVTGTVALTVLNSSTSANANTSTIRFINNASHITISKCNILGASSRAANATIATGTILFSTGTSGGNNNIIITDNYIGAVGTSFPSRAIASFGSSSTSTNNNNVISNNNIYDYFNETYSAGVYLNDNNTLWTISGNRFYQTGTRTGSGTGIHYAVFIDGNTVASGFQINNNTIGFSSEIGTGTYAVSGAATTFQAISVKAVGIGVNEVKGNSIRNIQIANSGTAVNYAINISATPNGISAVVQDNVVTSIASSGNWYVINLSGTGNNQQSSIINNSISAISLTGGARFYGILYNGGAGGISSLVGSNNIYDVSLNGSAAGTATGSPALVGIYAASGPVNISNNNIGDSVHSKSIQCIQTVGSTSSYDLLGIFVKGTDDQIVFNNRIGGFFSNNVAAASGTPRIFGLRNSGTGVVTFALNRIGGASDSSMHIASASTAASILGIYNNAGTVTINNNSFQNFLSPGGTGTLANSSTAGIVNASALPININGNQVKNLVSTGKSVIGILVLSASSAEISKNIVEGLRSSAAMADVVVNGVELNGATTAAIYQNRIAALLQSGAWPTKNDGVVNGILISGGAQAVVHNNIVGGLNVSSGGGSDVVRGISITSQEPTSNYKLYYNSVYVDATTTDTAFGSSALFHAGNTNASVANLESINNIFINVSAAKGSGSTRAVHREPDALNNYAVTTGNNIYYSVDTLPNHFIYNGHKTLAAFLNVSGSIDTSSHQALPPFETTNPLQPNFLHPHPIEPTVIESEGKQLPMYTSDFYGTTRFGAAGYSGNGTAPDIGAVEGDYQSHLLPVKFLSFVARTEGNNNLLNWITINEVNNAGYGIEKSEDGKHFISIGFAKANANESAAATNSYQFVDPQPFHPVSFYRLKQTDKDGRYSYSEIVSVSRNNQSNWLKAVYPNPVESKLYLEIESDRPQSVNLRFVNLLGVEQSVAGLSVAKGVNMLSVETSNLPSGIYILQVTMNEEKKSTQIKLLKK